MRALIQFCATATCAAAPPVVAVAPQQRRLFRWRTKGGHQERKNNIERGRRSVDDEKEDLMKVRQSIIEEAKTTAEFLSQLLSNGKSQQDNELIQEIYQKCKDLHATIMRYIEESHTSVQISTLIDANSELVKALESYNRTQSDLMRRTNAPLTILSDKALGKRPVRREEDKSRDEDDDRLRV
ncbi:hypothetical protein BJV82DRAFT_667969 [Fennellomyces sp. T-0311]|nr:hypothetical protein BJV82DRAFT_667969 [Fennellomyces sp. T-0311]